MSAPSCGPGACCPNGRSDRSEKPKRGKHTHTYPYVDENGVLLFEVWRYADPKGFAQRRPDPASHDGWKWSLGDVRRVLYRLPELLAADPAQTVFVCEGEKDANGLVSLGLIATTSPQGAGNWAQGGQQGSGRPPCRGAARQ